jgi:hypothetical protein
MPSNSKYRNFDDKELALETGFNLSYINSPVCVTIPVFLKFFPITWDICL